MAMQNNYNPDVLNCLANLSSDEVFTPPSLANQMLDLLPATIWKNKNAKFLDPVCKSGVFLREIAKRLMIGLEKEFPDNQERVNHIFQNQIFGIAITEITSLLSRRSIYCSKEANHEKSVATTFKTKEGNIIFNRIDHTWKNGKCEYCGASETEYGKIRDEGLERHAYQLIHTDKPNKIFKDMKFDVIIGNPPYQLSDGGAQKSATPIYNKFIEQAIKLNPRYMTMIVPARWYSGGKGLDEFRRNMLNDNRISEIHDFPDTNDCFPGLNIRGGVCYFLWNREHKGDCKVVSNKGGKIISISERPLLENGSEVFIRYNEAINILKKVKKFKEETFANLVSSRKPFGLPTNFMAFDKTKSSKRDIYLYRFGDNGFVNMKQIEKNQQWVKEYKVLVPKASPGDDSYPHGVLSSPLLGQPNSCCTETYILIGPFGSATKSKNVISYLRTRFVRFLILLIKNTQDVPKGVYQFVPTQNFEENWTDEKLYKKYSITKDEIVFIESLVKPME